MRRYLRRGKIQLLAEKFAVTERQVRHLRWIGDKPLVNPLPGLMSAKSGPPPAPQALIERIGSLGEKMRLARTDGSDGHRICYDAGRDVVGVGHARSDLGMFRLTEATIAVLLEVCNERFAVQS